MATTSSKKQKQSADVSVALTPTTIPPVPSVDDESIDAVVPASKGLYLSNKELFLETKKCKETGQMSNKLVKMLQLLCERLGRKGSFVDYSYNQDMQAYAMMMLVRTWQGFKPEKGTNAFAFYTQCIKNSFIQYLKQEKRQQIVRDKMMITSGLNPSYGYEDDGVRGIVDEGDFDQMQTTLESQTQETFVDAPIERNEHGEEITEHKATDYLIDIDPDEDEDDNEPK